MPAGLQIINDAGTVQIDDNYANFLLRGKGAVTTTGPNTAQAWYVAVGTIQVYGSNPQIFFEANDAFVCPVSRTISGSLHTFTIYTDVATTLNYYVFDNDIPAAPGNCGLQVFNGAGTLMYDSGNKPMRIIMVQPYGTFATGKNSLKLVAALSFSRVNLGQVGVIGGRPNIGWSHDSIRLQNAAIDAKRLVARTFPGSVDSTYPTQTNYPPSVILLDVTNM
ncbi:hypothetical protein [Pseudomonas nitroreducens]|uniref:hypothetical protein n=1 Tax=Pseudomonas nitroreducens TaxID=46680 RepID=UPI00265A14C2|nr:hypothetical protein [Pseudomonas nitroreducens]MCP1652731.1 hypothetical protein [Pseudomonas nitroreducens]